MIALSLTVRVLLKGQRVRSLMPSFHFKEYLIYLIYKSKLMFIKLYKIFRQHCPRIKKDKKKKFISV